MQGMSGVAFILSLIGGALMLVGGILSTFWFMSGGFNANGMMGGFGSMMGGFGVPFGFMGGLSFVGLLSGIVVIVGALMLNARPAEHMTWATLILVFSVISFLGMGGFYLGALLGMAGGAIALSWKPTAKH